MKIYYKATRPNGTDFFSGTIDYAAAVGGRVKAPSPPRTSYECCSDGVLHAADAAAETLVGGSWPCRLFEVTDRPVAQQGHKFGFRSLAVVREVDAHAALGPQGREVAALIERIREMTSEEIRQTGVARDAARSAAEDAAEDAAWDAARSAAEDAAEDAAWDAARSAARSAARDAAWDAARDAAGGLVVRDLIATEHYNTLTHALRVAGITVHPDDPAVVA